MLAEPGDVSLNSMLAEIDKLDAGRFVGIPSGALDDAALAILGCWRAGRQSSAAASADPS